MEEQRQQPYTEFAEPVRKVFRSDWMVLAAALFGAGFIILIVSYLGTLIGLPGLVSQIVSYALLLLFGLLIYKKALVRFSYRLTERMFVVTHVVGKKSAPKRRRILRRSQRSARIPRSARMRAANECGCIWAKKRTAPRSLTASAARNARCL